MASNPSQRRGAVAARRQQVKNNLLGSLGLNNQNPYSTYRPNVIDPLGMSTPNMQRGGFDFRYGIMPQPAQIDAYINSVLGSAGSYAPPQRRGGSGPGVSQTAAQFAAQSGASPGTALFEQLVAGFQAKMDEANAANIKRYDEGHRELSDLRLRNQDRVANWGKAAETDTQNRMQETLGNQRTELASRGLQNSSIFPAFEGKIAQRTNEELQRISEMRDARASEYDTRDTNALTGWVERRVDKAPSYDQLVGLAMQYGRSGMGQGIDSVQDEVRRQIQGLNRNQGYNPWREMNSLPSYGPTSPGPAFINPQAFYGNNLQIPMYQFGGLGAPVATRRRRSGEAAAGPGQGRPLSPKQAQELAAKSQRIDQRRRAKNPLRPLDNDILSRPPSHPPVFPTYV